LPTRQQKGFVISPESTLAYGVKCELAAESLRLSGSLRIKVSGWSMLPTIWPGDTLVLSTAQPSDIVPGDVALFQRDGNFFVHRVLEKNDCRNEILSQGDAMPEPDAPFASRQLLGKVRFILCGGKQIEPDRRLNVAQRALSGLLQRSEHAARIAVKAHQLYREH
jgi:signal peptidase I